MINQKSQEQLTIDDNDDDQLSKPQSVQSNENASTSRTAALGGSEGDAGTQVDVKIRDGLELLNKLAARINLLEKQFDESNNTFRNALKQSTDRLKIISQTLGIQSIKRGRQYLAAKLSAEQTQIECQEACVQFEQANNFHSDAKEAIRLAEKKFKCAASALTNENTPTNEETITNDAKSNTNEPITKRGVVDKSSNIIQSDNNNDIIVNDHNSPKSKLITDKTKDLPSNSPTTKCSLHALHSENLNVSSEEMNQAIQRLLEAEKLKGESQLRHQDKTKKMLIAQNHVSKLEREFSNSIRRSKPYFDEANRFNARLSSIKAEIDLITREIVSTKRKYAATLNDLESLSEEIHAERRYNHLLDPSSSECDSGLGSACDGFLNIISDDIMNHDIVTQIDDDQNNEVLYNSSEALDQDERQATLTHLNNSKLHLHDARQSVIPPLESSMDDKLTMFNEKLNKDDRIEVNESLITSRESTPSDLDLKKTIDCINDLLITNTTSIREVN